MVELLNRVGSVNWYRMRCQGVTRAVVLDEVMLCRLLSVIVKEVKNSKPEITLPIPLPIVEALRLKAY